MSPSRTWCALAFVATLSFTSNSLAAPATTAKSAAKKKSKKKPAPAPSAAAPVATPAPSPEPAAAPVVVDAPPAPVVIATPVVEPPATVSAAAPAPVVSPEHPRELVLLSVGAEWGARNVGYRDRLSATLSGYRGAMPLAEVRAEVYPAAFTSVPFLNDFGLFGRFSHSFAGSTATADSAVNLATDWLRYGAGARWRLRLSDVEVGGISASWGGSTFTFHGADALAPALLPGGSLSELRVGLDGRFHLGPVGVQLNVGGLLPSGLALGAAFPHAAVGGVDGSLMLLLRLGTHVELAAGVQYVRYFWKFNPVPGDLYVAGGAIDEQLFTDLRVGVVL